MSNISLSDQFSQIEEKKALLLLEEETLLKKGLESDNIEDIYSSRKYLQSLESRQKKEPPTKSILIDPFHLNSSFGYREKVYGVNYQTLRMMSKIHIVNSIIKTRISQVLSFCQPQPDKYSTGFVVKKKSQNRFGVDKESNSKEDQKIINHITDFIMNCGDMDNLFHGEDISSFTSRFLQDSLSLDQATFEVVRDRGGNLVEFFSTDAATFRLTDENDIYSDQILNGYPPHAIQLLDGRVVQTFYPWELCFGIRNPQTSIYKRGYGESELEILIKTITSILNSDHYNANFFRVGSNPRGLFRYSGNINQNTLHDFRQHWNATMTGVNNMHKVPFINADKIDWVTTHETNKDMEFSKYYEFLIKVTCAVYTIDPSEIGFPMTSGMDSKPMFEGNNEGRLKYSRDKGLRPLLKWYERLLNKFLVSQINNEYEIEFVGFEEQTEQNELDRDIKEVTNLSTIDEVRKKRGQEPLPDGMGKYPLNPMFLQMKQMEMYGGQSSNEVVDKESGRMENDLDNPFITSEQEDENPFDKSLTNYLNTL